MSFIRALALLFLLSGYFQKVQATDTLQISLQQADSMFLKNNYFLLAQQYNIQVQEAMQIQVRLYPNPVFSADVNAYNPSEKKIAQVGPNGEKAFSLEQLVLLGGKRRTDIEMARQNVKLAQLEFEDLVRNLRQEMHNTFYTLEEQYKALDKYSQQLKLLDTIIHAYEGQSVKGNVPVKDVVRLKAAYLGINNARSEFARQLTESLRNMQLMLHVQTYIRPVIESGRFLAFEKEPVFADMLNLATTNRPDARITDEQTLLAEMNLRHQRSLAVPDIAFNVSYDQRGGAFNNQVNAGLSLPLPLWNRNQGNIKVAEQQQKLADLYKSQKLAEMNAEVLEAYSNMVRSIHEYRKAMSLYSTNFEVVFKGVSDNFKKGNISLIEFVDFFESYNDAIAEIQRIRTQLATSAERVNYVTATQVY